MDGAAAQAAANRRLTETISDLPKFYGSSKDTISAETLISRIDSSIISLGWTPQQAYNFFKIALHADAEKWMNMITRDEDFVADWDVVKPLFRARFGKKMDVSKVAGVLTDLKMKPDENTDGYAARIDEKFSVFRELIPNGQIHDLPANVADRTDAVCERIHLRALNYLHGQYVKYFYIAGLPKFIMYHVANKEPCNTFKDARTEACKAYDLDKDGKSSTTSAIESKEEDSINQVRGNGSQNPYRGNMRGNGYRGRGNRGAQRGASRGAYAGGTYSGGSLAKENENGTGSNQNKVPSCWYCSIPGHRQDDCRKRQRDNKPCTAANGTTYWPKSKQAPIAEEQQETQGSISVFQ